MQVQNSLYHTYLLNSSLCVCVCVCVRVETGRWDDAPGRLSPCDHVGCGGDCRVSVVSHDPPGS